MNTKMEHESATLAGGDSPLLHLVEKVPFRPVFIVGDHRSGTTLLHRLLAETGTFNYVSAYQVIRYNHVLSDHLAGRTVEERAKLMDEFERLGLKDRIIDSTPATPEAPIEYGFILASPTNRRPRITAQTIDKFGELARKMQFVQDANKPLLLKNPWDVICFMDIKRYFPDAKFVFIHRHPVAIMNSQMRAIRSMLAARNGFVAMIAPFYEALWHKPLQLWIARAMDKPPFSLWERLLAHHTVKAANYFLNNHQKLPREDYITVQYEQLCREPEKTMASIIQFLDVHPEQPVDYAAKIAPRDPKLLPSIVARFQTVRKQLEPYLKFQGYDPDPKP